MKENCGHQLKEFALEDLSAVWKGGGEEQEEVVREVQVLLSSVILSPSPRLVGSAPSWELRRVRLRACPVPERVPLTRPSALIPDVIVHRGRDAGHYCGASASSEIACYSWTCEVSSRLRI